jgi:hypothetical protein
MASVFNHLAPPGRVACAPGALTCSWTLDDNRRLVGRWSTAPATPRALVAPAA